MAFPHPTGLRPTDPGSAAGLAGTSTFSGGARRRIPSAGLYDPAYEHDACGVAFVADIEGRRSHAVVSQGLAALCRLDHRGARGAEPNTGDGAGIMLQVPDEFYRAE